MVAEAAIKPGRIVGLGAQENGVNIAAGGDFGVYSAESMAVDKEIGEHLPVVMMGPARVEAGGTVHAGEFGTADADGKAVEIAATAGLHEYGVFFLQGGAVGELVEVLVERGSVTVPAA
jgi:hypothetical protein